MQDLKLLKSKIGNYYGNFNDLGFSKTNDLEIVEGKKRTKQNIVKTLLTERGSNKKYPHYGTYLQKVNFLNVPQEQKIILIRESIVQGLKYLQVVEESEEESEVLDMIESIDFKPSIDPRSYQVNIDVRLLNGNLIKIILEEDNNAQ